MRWRWRQLIHVVVAALLCSGGCGGAGAASPPRTFTWSLRGHEFGFSAAVTRVPAGVVRVELQNQGAEEHQASLVRLPPGVQPFDLVLSTAKDRTGGTFFPKVDGRGGPADVRPGATGVTRQVLRPGQYVLMCLIRSRDGVSHAEKGMILPFTVVGRQPRATVDAPTSVKLREFGFDGPSSFAANSTAVVENAGGAPHELVAYRIDDGRTPEDVAAFLKSYPSGADPPMQGAGGAAFLSPGGRAVVTLPPAGRYVFVCFLPTADGVPHFKLGMVKFVDVR